MDLKDRCFILMLQNGKQRMSRKAQKGVLIVSIILFVVSLFTPSLEELNFGTHREIMPGYLVLAWGWNAMIFFILRGALISPGPLATFFSSRKSIAPAFT